MSLWLVAGFGIVVAPIFLIVWSITPDEPLPAADRKTRIQVLVLGDIGRSPRMQNHALSLVKAGALVDLIGYVDSELHPGLVKRPEVTVHPIAHTPGLLQTNSRALFPLLGPLKALYQVWSLWMILFHDVPHAQWLLVQNPPSIPTLLVAKCICWLRKTKLAIDWHNYGYSILALRLGPKHPLVRISYVYEKWLGRAADVNFTVSEAMGRQLKREFHLRAPIKRLYDRPNADFQPASLAERQKFLASEDLLGHLEGPVPKGKFKTVVSSTSWTPDEDFSILLEALVAYSKESGSKAKLPELLVIITGKGPQKQMYADKIQQLESEGKLGKVTIKMAWLPTSGYAKLLSSADVGISLHQSSSGVDLPMKVVDMFGAGLPVVGWGTFESWPELVKDGVNGRSFDGAEELHAILVQLLAGDGSQLKKLRNGVIQERDHDWDAEWRSSAGQAFGLVP